METRGLSLHIPQIHELWYRQQLMEDPATMSYNRGYDLPFEGYHRETGCIDFPQDEWADWHAYFIGNEPERFYAYVVREEDGAFIGEVNVHRNPGACWHEMGIVLEAKYRGMGYAEEALRLLLAHAFDVLGADAVHNDFEDVRDAAVRTHLACGFTEYARENGVLELLITRGQYVIQNRKCISIVGAGGKTSLMNHLAGTLAQQGKRAAAITSTRISRTEGYCTTVSECLACWQKGQYAVCGAEAENGKLSLPAPEMLDWLLAKADVIVCEADGAKHMACKAPADHEPVILTQSDLVIGVMGLDVLGGEVDAVCHRPERVRALLGCGGAHRLTEADMAKLLLSEQGTRKHVGSRDYCVVLNKCDDGQRLEAGKRIAAMLKEQGQCMIALTQLREGRIRWIYKG